MVTGFRRPYRFGSESVAFCEAFDWFCLPDLRRSGLGVRVLQRMMQDPEPLTVIGGTEDTRELLPRLKWQVPAKLRTFALAVGTERGAAKLERTLRLPSALARPLYGNLVRPFVLPPRVKAPPGGRVLPVATPGEEVVDLYASVRRGTVPAWTLPQLRWLIGGFPSVGQFLTLYFLRGDALAGWALVRIHSGEDGREAQLVEVFSPDPAEDLYAWMISEATHLAAAFDPGSVSAATTCPEMTKALLRNRFRPGEELPIHYWHREGRPFEEPLRFNGNWGDAPLLPYVERWWGTPASPEEDPR